MNSEQPKTRNDLIVEIGKQLIAIQGQLKVLSPGVSSGFAGDIKVQPCEHPAIWNKIQETVQETVDLLRVYHSAVSKK